MVLNGLTGAAEAEASARLTPGEIETLVSLAEAIVDDQPLSPAARHDLAESIADATHRSEDQRAVYRATAVLLDRLAGGAFARLDLGDRVALVGRHRLDVRTVAPADTVSEETGAVRTRVVPDLIAAYWGSPAGWAAVGYEAFPGRCGDLTRYTRPDA